MNILCTILQDVRTLHTDVHCARGSGDGAMLIKSSLDTCCFKLIKYSCAPDEHLLVTADDDGTILCQKKLKLSFVTKC